MQQAQKNSWSLSYTTGTAIRMREDDSSPTKIKCIIYTFLTEKKNDWLSRICKNTVLLGESIPLWCQGSAECECNCMS